MTDRDTASRPTLARVAFAMRVAAVVLVAAAALRGALEVAAAYAFDAPENAGQMSYFVRFGLLVVVCVGVALFWGASGFARASRGDAATVEVALRRLNTLLALQFGCAGLVLLGACATVIGVLLLYLAFGGLAHP